MDEDERVWGSGRICQYAKACMSELRRVCYWVENILYGLRWMQGWDRIVLCHKFSIVCM